jgi:tetratricopeptide (TPR) repeat protein
MNEHSPSNSADMRNAYNIVFTLTFLLLATAAWLMPGMNRPTSRVEVAPVEPSLVRRQGIAFYERRLTEDPQSALDMAQLAALFMEEGRMAGDESAFVVAESLARKSLGERTRRNGRSAALLANALLAQHRFIEADSVARELVNAEPDQPAYRALLAETAMERGEYDDAIRQLGSIRARREDLGIAPRFARWAELTGRTGEARRILQKAREDVRLRSDLMGEQRAWFDLRLADMELRHGNLRNAASAISDGLKDSPKDWRLVLTRARLEAAKGQWKRSIASAEEVLTQVSSPDALALLATAHRQLGHDDDAELFEVALEQVALNKPGSVHRSWAMTLLDNGSKDQRLLALATADTLVRHDVHTLDLLAWALYRAGRPDESLPLMRRAMSIGPNEPSLRYHAAMIEFVAGDETRAHEHRRVALSRGKALTSAQLEEMRQASER